MNPFKNVPMLLLGAALIVTAAGTLVGAGTTAIFTDTATSTANTFTTGVVDLELADDVDDNVTATVSFTANMVPGESTTSPTGGLKVENNNSGGNAVQLRYSVSSAVASGSTVLAPRLDLLIGKRASTGTCDGTATFGASEASANLWTLIYQGDLARTSSFNLVGNPSQGSHSAGAGQISGDRTLAAAGTEFLCFRVTFKDATDNTGASPLTGEGSSTAHSYTADDTASADDNPYQGLTSSITFTFYAEQTTSN